MQLAYYNNTEKRVRPRYSGQKGTCPLCGGTVIGKCGEIYVRHWQHKHDENCDPWSEPETPWHREWKARFPEDMQEIVIVNFREKHRADIKTYFGTVIEFQHSSISKQTIRTREEFYDDIIWVIDAESFKDNIRKYSIVQARLKDIDKDTNSEISIIEQENNDELKRLKDIIKENDREIFSKYRCLEYNKEILDKMIYDIENIDEIGNAFTFKLETKEIYLESHSADITNDLGFNYSKIIREIPIKISEQKKEFEQIQKTAEEINSLESIEIDGKIFKIVTYSSLTNKNFQKARAILKVSRKTFFIEVKKIQSLTEFQSYKYKQDKFDFAIDPSDAFTNLQNKLTRIKILISETENSIPKLKSEFLKELLKGLKTKVEKLEIEQKQLSKELEELKASNNDLNTHLLNRESALKINLYEYKKELEKEKEMRRRKIMIEKKGIYTFQWKHERKSWQDAMAKIYFDFGDNYVYEQIREDVFKRITVQEFVTIHSRQT